jgi:hypothetical protein
MKQDAISLESVAGAPAEAVPYLRLWAEVMRLGVVDFCNARAVRSDNKHPHIQWLWSEQRDPGNFLWLCDLFHLDPENARSQVLIQWRKLVDKREMKRERDNG